MDFEELDFTAFLNENNDNSDLPGFECELFDNPENFCLPKTPVAVLPLLPIVSTTVGTTATAASPENNDKPLTFDHTHSVTQPESEDDEPTRKRGRDCEHHDADPRKLNDAEADDDDDDDLQLFDESASHENNCNYTTIINDETFLPAETFVETSTPTTTTTPTPPTLLRPLPKRIRIICVRPAEKKPTATPVVDDDSDDADDAKDLDQATTASPTRPTPPITPVPPKKRSKSEKDDKAKRPKRPKRRDLSVAQLFIFLAKYFDCKLEDLRQVKKRDNPIMDKFAPIVDGLRGVIVAEVQEGKDQRTATLENGMDQFRRKMKDATFLEYPEEKLEEIRELILNSACSNKIKNLFRDDENDE